MCIWNGEYIISPKVVGDKLEAGIYAFNDDGTPIKSIVKLKGYNPATSKWLTFAQTTPNSSGWAGMPLNAITEEMLGTWRMSWEVVDVCGAQSEVPDLMITKVSVPIYLSSDKYSIQKGDTVTFIGVYKANTKLGIWDVTDILDVKVCEATCDIHGDFKVSVNLNVPEGRREFQSKSFDIIPDKSGTIYIDVHPKTHLECVSGVCTRVSTSGTDTCTTEGTSCGTVITKELVTNLTSDENLIKAVIVMTETPGKYTYVRKYQEGADWVFVFNCNTEFNYLEFGAGAGLAKFIGANWTSIAWLLATAGIITIVWMWRDVSTKAIELEGKLSDDTTNRIKLITDNTELTPEEKAKLISEVLGAYKESKPSTGLCDQLGLDDQTCSALKYVGIGIGALIVGYTVYKVLPKNK